MTGFEAFLRWISSQGAMLPVKLRSCLSNDSPPTGKIEVVTEMPPPERRLCVHGGRIHCPHGEQECCWCEVHATHVN